MESLGILEASSPSLQMHDERSEETNAVPSSSKKRKSVSEVWNDFDKVIINGKDKAVCKHCNKGFVGSSKSGTTHLKNHLSRYPATKDVETHQKMMNTTCLEKAGVGGDFVFDNEMSRLDVARMIIKHGYPLDMVEHEFFQIFVKNLQPKFKLYSQDTLKADIFNVYKKEKEKLYKYLGTLSCHFNLIIQFWTCHTKKNVYCCLALQFLKDGLILKKKILALKKVVQYNDIAVETLFGTVTSLLREWNIDKKLCSITLESSYSNDVMVRELESRIHHRTCRRPLCGHFFHIHCITSIINHLLQDGLKEIGGVLCKIRSTIRYINEASGLWKMNYQSTLKQHNLQDKYSTICEDVSTRWDSSFLMLESALELRKVFSLLEENDRDFVAINPSVEEWDMVVVIYKYLKVLYDAICSFSGIKCLTANVYFPKVCSIHLRLLELQKSEHTYIRMAVRMKEKFDKYFRECITVLAIAIILDPRKKFDFVRFAFEHLNGCHEAGNILAYIRNTLNDIFDDYAKELGMQASSSSSVNNHNSNSFPSHFDHDNCDMLDMWYESKHRNSVACPRAELDRYLGGEIIDNADRDFDILGWWGANSLDFPIVGQMTLDILGIPMSTCAISDSDFNTESMTMINPVFDGLDPEIIEALICGEYWLGRPTKKVPNKEDEHSSGYSLNGGPTDHNYTSMALAAPTLSNSEFDQEKADSPSAASTRLMLASPSSILSPEINCYLLTPRSRTFPLIVPQEPLSPSLHYIPIMGLSPTRLPPLETESLNSGAPPCSLFGQLGFEYTQ